MGNAELELRRIKVLLILIGIILLFGACSISNIATRYESHEDEYHHNNDVEGILQSSIPLKNDHFAVVKDEEVLVYRFDEKEGTLIPVTKKYINEWDEGFDDVLDEE